MLTKKQLSLIAYLKNKGYGWRKYAASIEKQGWCSEKQEITMINMKSRLGMFNRPYHSRHSFDGIDVDDYHEYGICDGQEF